MTYPISLQLRDRDVLVVGGGPVAARRARALLQAEARVTVVSPYLCEDLVDLVAAERVAWKDRDYRSGDVDGSWLVLTQTGSKRVDAQVAAEAEAARIWCVTASDAEASAAWVPAVARIDEVIVAVNAGVDPRRAMAVRDAVAAQLETGTLPVRRRRRAAPDGAEDAGMPVGSVALVGGGPGDAGLVTARGRHLVATADVVVADRLGPRSVLDDLDPDVEIIEVGKTPGNHPVPQDLINRILVDQARLGRRVVRLKGGDPYVLGRGGEEAEYCRAHGIPVEVVPGVTSAVSVPAAAGIPVTHRGLARGFTVVTGHDEIGSVPARRDHTLVLLMGVTRLRETADSLVAQGLPAETPVAVVERGWTPEQRVTVGTLTTIAERAAGRGVRSPAVIVVGDVVTVSPHWG